MVFRSAIIAFVASTFLVNNVSCWRFLSISFENLSDAPATATKPAPKAIAPAPATRNAGDMPFTELCNPVNDDSRPSISFFIASPPMPPLPASCIFLLAIAACNASMSAVAALLAAPAVFN